MSYLNVRNVGKAYKRYPGKWARLAEWITGQERHEKHWVLRDISFEVAPGEAVGIIGINGAGKSTLLKVITGTAQPTTGSVEIGGRVAALLELGMGFHPDFTGRQNVYMGAQINGLFTEQIGELMPKIEDFAEIGDYIDQPLRTYSSGMQMRLAFSVATAIRPDVLIIDEALSVGDAYFQHKSFDRIRKFGAQGTTLLIVSHDRNAIQTICNRAILLKAGVVVKEGEPEEVMDYYSALLADHQSQIVKQTISVEQKVKTDSGTYEAQVTQVEIFDAKGQKIEVVPVGAWVTVRITVIINRDIDGLVLGFGIKDRLGQMVFGTNTFHTKQRIEEAKKGEICLFDVSFHANLGVGSFSIHCSLVRNESHVEKNYHWIDRAKVFEVVNVDKPLFVGCAWNNIQFKIKKFSDAQEITMGS